MTTPCSALLPHRGVLAIAGDDRATFLQGLVSNDVTKATATQAVWVAFLTPQGKYLHDGFLIADGDTLLLETDAASLDDLTARLKKYKLRAKVTMTPRPDLCVAAIFGAPAAPAGGICFTDPRLPEAGQRAILPTGDAAAQLAAAGCKNVDAEAYEHHRISLGLPDGARDLISEKTFLMEAGFDELHGIDFTKGCYIGQETTARMKHRALTKKRLTPISISGPTPPPGTLLTRPDGSEAGEIRSARGQNGLAIIKISDLDGGPLTAADAIITPRKPEWMILPDPAG